MISTVKRLTLAALLFSLAMAYAKPNSEVKACEVNLSSLKAKEIFHQYASRRLSRVMLHGTPLEVSTYMQEWTGGLAKKLGVESSQIKSYFLPSLKPSFSREIQVVLVETHYGVRALIVKELDMNEMELKFIYPLESEKTLRTLISRTENHGYRLAAFEDLLHPHGTDGNVIGTLTLRSPPLLRSP